MNCQEVEKPGRAVVWAALALTMGIASSASAQAGEGDTCGDFGWLSVECAPGLECETRWTWGQIEVGECVEVGPAFCGGLLGLQCQEGEFCNYGPDANCGRADMTGTCAEVPQYCTKEYVPVCGCDGRTYGNACEAHAHGVSVEHEGACGECTQDTDCPHGWCDFGVTCMGMNCPPPPPNRCTVCGDGTPLRCRKGLLPCPEGQVREIVNGCYGECVDRYSCEPPKAGTCEVDGQIYEVGETFPAADGCNDCVCNEDGRVACTEKACLCDYDDPEQRWISKDRKECSMIQFMCEEGLRPFFNDCGCGCEPAPVCDYDDPTARWVSKDREECTRIDFRCEEGLQPFSNDCGCGCEPEVPVDTCDYDDAAQRWISKDPKECSVIRFKCEEGLRPFFNDCGCGCEPEPPADCRSEGCGEGDYCSFCWGSFQCIPEGAVC